MVERLYAIFHLLTDPNNLTAISTLVIALFTIVLAVVGYCQARMIRKSIDLAREEFVSTHRPIIRVRRVFYGSMLGAEHLSHGDNFKIDLLITNVGAAMLG